jgi:hypothetical protein
MAPGQDRAGNPDSAVLSVSRLQCLVGNNEALGEHRAGYNGVFWMTSPDCDASPFVPRFAGLNLESFFDARPPATDRSILFEPRHSPMTLQRLGPASAELSQETTRVFGLESRTRFELKEPYYLDMTFSCVPRNDALAGGFFGVLWASYINDPGDKSIYFLGDRSALDKPCWVQFMAQQHNRDTTVLSEEGAADRRLDKAKLTLAPRISPLRYSVPFFYGCFRNMVLLYIFRPDPGICFAHSPTGGGPTAAGDGRNPAWDFELIVPDYKVGQQYGLSARVVCRPWVNRQEVIREVRDYLKPSGDG